MVFSSTIFLFAFLPLFSLLFYAWGEPVYVWLMVASICFNWLFAFIIGKCGEGKTAPKRFWLVAALAANLLVLGFYKYQGFLAENINRAIGEEFIAELNLALPIGISFFTFQGLSYVIDVYRGDAAVQRDPLKLALYIAFFPQLVAGPIVRYTTVAEEIDERHESVSEFSAGAVRFLFGLGKKMLLANAVARIADAAFAAVMPSVLFAWLGAVAYTFQIYFDFSGYSDMAIGLGKMMGFEYPRNFNYPYTSKSATEFWRRWHISLSSWVRDYLFLPLSSFTRRWGQWGVAASLMVTFIALGVWHGAGWTFAVYGFIQGLVIVWELRTERIRNKVRKHIGGRLFAMLSVIRTYLIFAVSLVFFKAKSVSDAFYFLRNISFQTHASWKEINIGMSDHICIVAGAAVLLMLLYDFFMSKGDLHRRLERQPILLRWTIYYLIVFALFAYGKFGTENFIYLQF